jgi:hypothetical protein
LKRRNHFEKLYNAQSHGLLLSVRNGTATRAIVKRRLRIPALQNHVVAEHRADKRRRRIIGGTGHQRQKTEKAKFLGFHIFKQVG